MTSPIAPKRTTNEEVSIPSFEMNVTNNSTLKIQSNI
jgi:hypothetical protein